jgi:hypothetical protein
MWRFSTADERRYDHLLGLVHERIRQHDRRTGPPRRRYLLSAAARYSRWRDGRDTRRAGLCEREAARVEKALIRDLVHIVDTPGGV